MGVVQQRTRTALNTIIIIIIYKDDDDDKNATRAVGALTENEII
jgi:hypothetical protein